MNAELAKQGARLDAFYYCPYHDDAAVEAYRVENHPDRKPNPGMILRALEEWSIDPARALVIGDRDTDVEAAEGAGLRGALYDGGDLAALVARETSDW
jgi:D-glycero-D-manno-heptose 1,7-bisphosphate phosphatase